MKKLFLPLFFISFLFSKAQECKTYVLHYDNVEEMEYFCSLDPVTGEVVKLNYIPDVQFIQHGFSGINSVQGLYYFYGIDANFNGVFYSMDLLSGSIVNAIDFPTTEIDGNIIEMHYHPFNNLIYALHWDNLNEMEYFISFSPISGEIIKIDSFPDVHYIQSDFSALNYLNNEYYFMGIDYNNDARLYTIDINTGEIKHNPITPSENINGGLNELEVDIYRGFLYSLHYDQSENMEYFTKINKLTGEVEKIAPIPDVQSIQAGFSAINSNDGQYYFNGITASFDAFIYTIDIYTGNIINQSVIFGDNLNGGLNEMQFPNFEPVPLNMSQTTICNEDSALIMAPEGFASYMWSNGSEENHIYVSDSLEYSLILTKEYGCADTILPMPLQVYNCDDYTDSIVQMHDTCLFDPGHIVMNFISNVELNGSQVVLDWNFVSIHSDTVSFQSEYEINENGLYELIMGFDCNKSQEVLYSNMLQFNHLDPVGLNNPADLIHLSAYPNPFKDILFVEFDDLKISNLSKIKILNNASQLVFEKNSPNSSEKIDLSALPSGIYLLILENTTGIQTKKIIKSQ
jgi:hypothetical protein